MSSEQEIFTCVLEELTSDQFLGFVERFLNSKVLLPGMDVVTSGEEPVSPVLAQPIDGRLDWINLPGAAQGNPEYGPHHLECFKEYKALYESRLKSTLKRFNLREEGFLMACAKHVEEDDASQQSAQSSPVRAPNGAGLSSDGEALAGPAQICRTIIVMVECIEDFRQFADLMAQTQLGDDGDNDLDIEGSNDGDAEYRAEALRRMDELQEQQ